MSNIPLKSFSFLYNAFSPPTSHLFLEIVLGRLEDTLGIYKGDLFDGSFKREPQRADMLV